MVASDYIFAFDPRENWALRLLRLISIFRVHGSFRHLRLIPLRKIVGPCELMVGVVAGRAPIIEPDALPSREGSAPVLEQQPLEEAAVHQSQPSGSSMLIDRRKTCL